MEAVPTTRMGKESEAKMNLLIDGSAPDDLEETIKISLPMVCNACGSLINDRPYRWMVFDFGDDCFVHPDCQVEMVLIHTSQFDAEDSN